MKSLLCYGDSNTHGSIPGNDQNRFLYYQRWTGLMAQELGRDYYVVEEGLPGRTTIWEDPVEPYRNGKDYLMPCLLSHKPIDLVILMLGTNDLKARFSVPAVDIAAGAGMLVDMIQKSQAGLNNQAPLILLVAPPPVGKMSEYDEMFGPESLPKSRKFGQYFQQIAEQYGCHFLNASSVIKASDIDGIHYEMEEQQKLGSAMARLVRQILA